MRVTNKCLKRRNSRSSSLKMELKVPEILWALKKSSYRLGFLSHTSLIHYFVSPFFLPFLQNIIDSTSGFLRVLKKLPDDAFDAYGVIFYGYEYVFCGRCWWNQDESPHLLLPQANNQEGLPSYQCQVSPITIQWIRQKGTAFTCMKNWMCFFQMPLK